MHDAAWINACLHHDFTIYESNVLSNVCACVCVYGTVLNSLVNKIPVFFSSADTLSSVTIETMAHVTFFVLTY